MKLSDLPLNTLARVTRINTNSELKNRLINMGLKEGVAIKIRKSAPLFDPIEVFVCGVYLAIRLLDADKITVELI